MVRAAPPRHVLVVQEVGTIPPVLTHAALTLLSVAEEFKIINSRRQFGIPMALSAGYLGDFDSSGPPAGR